MSKKNIVLFILDQLTWSALPAYGNRFAQTPNIDRVAQNSLRVDSCYTACPLCQPSRASLWTGRYPHETGVLSNGKKWPEHGIPKAMPTLGEVFANAGWQTIHFGKTHDQGGLRGFVCEPEKELALQTELPAFPLNSDSCRDAYTVKAACTFLENRRDDRPLFMVTDLVNPHNICGWVGKNQGVHSGVPAPLPLPPLPENFTFEDIASRPAAVRYICCTNNRQAQAAGWTDQNFREYLRAYYYYLSLADRQLGKVLDRLEQKGHTPDNTLFIVMADHGDSMAAHGLVTKQVNFYEEITRVPLLFKGAGVKEGHAAGLASLLDLFPTLCGWAGIPAPEGLRGCDLSQTLAGAPLPKRDYVACEWHTEWGYTVSPGRMLRTPRYKYTCYIEDGAEELFDLAADPLEKQNRAADPAYCYALEQLRQLFRQHLQATADPFEQLTWKADRRWRGHRPGYQHHHGPAAPMLDEI